jgi:hypothetical protein
VDWKTIKAEYIAGGTSYRKLAAKYGVSRTAIQKRAREDKWVELRSQTKAKTDAKISDEVSDKESAKAVKIIDVADKLIERISNTIDKMGVIDPQSLKHFTSALKDLKDIRGFKTDLDLKEQKARIAKLEKEAKEDTEDSSKTITVKIEGGDASWQG